MKLNRRALLKASCEAAGAVALSGATDLLAGGAAADAVYTNGAILTMSSRLPVASAMAVKGDKVLAVGVAKAVDKYVGAATKRIDLRGRGVSPGLIDAHSHLVGFGQMELMYVLLRPPKVRDFASLGRALAAAARNKPRGEWIVGRGFQEFREGRFPRRWELDKVVPGHPVLIIHWGGQFGVANTLALKKANLLRKNVADPYGGKYLRDRSGLPDGVLIHYPAIYSVHKPLLSEAEQLQCARWATRRFVEKGVTCVHDNFIHPMYARTYVRLERAGELPLRIRVYPYVWNLKHVQMLLARMRRYRGPLVRMQGVKLAVDGYALMYDLPAKHRHLCSPMHPKDQFEQIIRLIHNAGYQVDVHAVGDRGVDWTLEAFAKAAGGAHAVRKRRHRIEHFPFRKTDSIRRAAEMGAVVCTQPAIIDVRAEDFLKKFARNSTLRKLVDRMIPLRSFLQSGVRLAFGADVPAFPSHLPLDSIRFAMDRRTPTGRRLNAAEAVTFADALRIHTQGGAWAAFDEDELGTLAPGKLADFVLWNADLRKVRTAAHLRRLKALATYVGGRKVFDAASA